MRPYLFRILFILFLTAPTLLAHAGQKYPQFLSNEILTILDDSDSKNKLHNLIELFEKGDLYEKEIALDHLGFLKSKEYREDADVFNPILNGLKHKDPQVRRLTAAYFKDMAKNSSNCCKETNIVPSLIEALKDEDPDTRKEAAKALGYFRDKQALDPLLLLLQDKDPWVRVEAVFALGELRDQKAVLPLAALLYDDSGYFNKFVQQECLIAIRKIGQGTVIRYRMDGSVTEKIAIEEDLISQITPVLMNRFNDPYLKAEIIKTFGKLRIKESEALLNDALNDSNDRIRRLAVESLAKVSPINKEEGDDNSSINVLIASLKDPSSSVRGYAVVQLGKSGDERAIDPLIEALNDTDKNVQIKAINALAVFRQERILDSLIVFFGKGDYNKEAKKVFLSVAKMTSKGRVYYFKKDGVPSIVQDNSEIPKGAGSSKRIIHPHAEALLIHKLEDADHESIGGVLDMLQDFHSEGFVPPLIDLLENPSPGVRMLSLSRLYWIIGAKAYPYIINALSDTGPDVRENATEIIGDFPTEQALDPLLKMLDDPEEKVRASAATSLGKIKDNKSIDPLIGALSDELFTVREAALQSLGKFDDPRIYDLNLKMLEDKAQYVRRTAVENIIKMPDKRAVEPLISLLNDNDRNMQMLAAEAMGEIGDERCSEPLIKVLETELNKEQGKHLDLCKEVIPALAKIGDKNSIAYLTKALEVKGLETTAKKALESFDEKNEKQTGNASTPQTSTSSEPKGEGTNRSVGVLIGTSAPKFNTETKRVLLSEGSVSANQKSRQGATKEAVEIDPSTVGGEYHNAYPIIIKDRATLSDNAPMEVGLSAELKGEAIKSSGGAITGYASPQGSGSINPAKSASVKKDSLSDKGAKDVKQDEEEKEIPVQELISSLKDTDKKARTDAARQLGLRRAKDAAEALIQCLDEQDTDVKAAVIWALGEINDPGAVRTLAPLIKDHDERIRTSAFNALGKIDAPDAREALINALARENDHIVRIEAADTLGNISANDAVPALITLLEDNNEYVRQAGARALGKIKNRHAVAPLLKHLNDSDFYVRISVIEALKKINDARAVAPLLECALADEDNRISSACLDVIKGINEPDATEIMKRIFTEEYSSVSSQDLKKAEIILTILGKNAVLHALEDPDGDDRKTISNYATLMMVTGFSSLEKLGEGALKDFEDRGLVIDCVSDLIKVSKKGTRYEYGISQAVSFLNDLKDPLCIPAFIHVIENRKYYQQSPVRYACKALGNLHYTEGVPLLMEVLDNRAEDCIIRIDTAEALGNIGAKESVSSLIEIVKNRSEDRSLRQSAAGALGNIKDKSAVDPLILILKDKEADTWLRVSAAETLGEIGDQKAIGPIEAVSGDKGLGQVTQNALKKLRSME